MQPIEIKGVGNTIYRETLPCGLDVILIPNAKENTKKNYYVNYGVYYGADNNEFIPYQKKQMHSFAPGIAHFLEHKMFEMEDGTTPFNFYSETGTYVNAYTSYRSTCYVISGSKNLKENLKYLFRLVANPYFTDENVAKEQGIIQEEIHMRDDDPDYLAMKILRKNMFHHLPEKTPVIGSVESIQKITKEDLYTAYRTFYRPKNMFLVISGCFDKEEIYQTILDATKKFPQDFTPCTKKYHEPVKVVKEYEEQTSDIKIEKLAIGYKMKRADLSIKDDILLDLYTNMLISLNFGSTSTFFEQMKENHILIRCGYTVQTEGEIRTFVVETDTTRSAQFIKCLEEKLQDLTITEEDMERMKKVWISGEVVKSDYADALLDSFVDDLVTYRDIVVNYIEKIRSMNIETMRTLIKELDFSNRSIAKVLPQNE